MNIFYKMPLSLIIILLASSLCITFAQEKGSITKEEVYPGIIHEKIINKKDRLVINILSIDLKNKSYEIDAVKAHNLLGSKETTSRLSARLNKEGLHVIAAVNADFWEPDGEIINNMISSGMFVKAVSGHSDDRQKRIFSQFALTGMTNL